VRPQIPKDLSENVPYSPGHTLTFVLFRLDARFSPQELRPLREDT